jgi:hypothetical protein
MSDYGLRDRAFRFDVTARLWRALDGAVTPDAVQAIANGVYAMLDGENDPLEIVEREVAGADVPAQHRPAVVSLTLMVMDNMAHAELAGLRAQR